MAESLEIGVLLKGMLEIDPQKTKYIVVVTRSHVTYQESVDLQDTGSKKKHVPSTIKIADILGCDCMRGKSSDCNNSYLNIYTYAHHKKIVGKNTLRKRKVVSLIFKDGSSFEENHKEANRWQVVMTHLIRRTEIRSLQGIYVQLLIIALNVSSRRINIHLQRH